MALAHLTDDLGGLDIAHRYGPESFTLYRLPHPMPGKLLGLLGPHSIGKSTALKFLAGELRPNLGRLNNPPEWQEILTHFRREDMQLDHTHFQHYYTKLAEEKPKVVVKPQQVARLSCYTEPLVRNLLEKYNDRGIDMMKKVCDDLDLNEVLDGRVRRLTAHARQRVMIAVSVLQKADIYIFDEPSNFLDVKQRFKAAQLIRSLLTSDSYVIVADNDISLLDYLSDELYCFYGKPGEYGVVSLPFNARVGIEVFLSGFSPSQNLRFRDESESLIFEAVKKRPRRIGRIEERTLRTYKYPDMRKTDCDFALEVEAGEFTDPQILVMLGETGTGKSVFMEMLAGLEPPDERMLTFGVADVSYKPQQNAWGMDCTVRQLPEMRRLLTDALPEFESDVMKPLRIEQLLDREVASLSRGETERVAITLCLGRNASLYLIDEPGTHLDSELRINAAMAIKRHMLRVRAAAVVVEHDLIMATYLADQVIVVEGKPGGKCTAKPPYPLVRGMNIFLSHHLNITFSQDEDSFELTPRVNKLGSIKDMEQKAAGRYYDVE